MKNANIRNHYDAFVRIHTFGVKYAAEFPPAGRGGRLFAEMATIIPQLERAGVGQFSGETEYHSGTSAKLDSVERLRDQLRQLRDTARAIGSADRDPRFADPFHLPKSRSVAALMTQGQSVLEAATPLAARFIDFEMPVDFIVELTAELARLATAVNERDTGFSAQIGGTTGLLTVIEAGIEVRKQLGSVVRNKFKTSPVALAEWESASRIVRVRYAPRAEKVAQPKGQAA